MRAIPARKPPTWARKATPPPWEALELPMVPTPLKNWMKNHQISISHAGTSTVVKKKTMVTSERMREWRSEEHTSELPSLTPTPLFGSAHAIKELDEEPPEKHKPCWDFDRGEEKDDGHERKDARVGKLDQVGAHHAGDGATGADHGRSE